MGRKKLTSKQIETNDVPVYNKDHTQKRLRLSMLWCGASGPSKRALFFSIFALLAIAYIILSMFSIVPFDTLLGTFILGCNTAFGINYYKNEKYGAHIGGIQ